MNDLMDRQLAAWPEAARRYRDLQKTETKEIDLGGMPVRVQFNPARAVSTLARTDAAAIKARPCFLCRDNRPAQQEALPFEGCDGRRYEILVNPFPIFPEHYTVPAMEHTPQRIAGRFPDMLRLAEAFPDMVVFYNGPESGASAPDHFHFQMGCRGFLPVETHFDRLRPVTVMRPGRASIAVTSGYIPGLPVITAPDGASAAAAFLRVLRSLPVSPATGEPQLNILCWKDTLFRTLVIPRKAHRPSTGPYASVPLRSTSEGCSSSRWRRISGGSMHKYSGTSSRKPPILPGSLSLTWGCSPLLSCGSGSISRSQVRTPGKGASAENRHLPSRTGW